MSDATIKSLPRFHGFTWVRPRLLPLFAYLAVFFCASLFFVWSRIAVVNLEYDISSLGNRLREVEQENRKLRLESAHLRSLERLERVSREDLGLGMPTPEQVVIVD